VTSPETPLGQQSRSDPAQAGRQPPTPAAAALTLREHKLRPAAPSSASVSDHGGSAAPSIGLSAGTAGQVLEHHISLALQLMY